MAVWTFFGIALLWDWIENWPFPVLDLWTYGLQTFVSKVMSLLFTMVSRFVTAFLLRSKHLWISCLQSLSIVILELRKIKSVSVSSFSPSVCMKWLIGCHDFVFWMLSFKPAFSLVSFTFIKRLFSSSSLSVIRVIPAAYLRLLIFLPAVLIAACDSSSPAFRMMYSANKLNKQSDNIQPVVLLSQL